MKLRPVHMRVLFGVGAWLLGVAAATAASLLAVSLLGHGIIDTPGQQLSVAAVSRALASESAEAGESASSTQAPRPRRAARAPQSPRPRTAPPRRASAPVSPVPSQSPSTSPSGGSVLTSRGGTVVAECGSSGAYLVSWSPQQGYEADDVTRGPAATAQVSFESDAGSVTMVVSCRAGVPHATSYSHGHGGDE